MHFYLAGEGVFPQPFLLADGSVSWSGLLLSKFARLMKAANARVRWGGDWPGFKDRPHIEV